MAEADALAFYDQQVGDPATGYITPERAQGAVSQTYADFPSLAGLVASSDITTIEVMTDAEYAALPTKDPNTLYVTTG